MSKTWEQCSPGAREVAKVELRNLVERMRRRAPTLPYPQHERDVADAIEALIKEKTP